ncbi:phytoene desaturase family protein [Paenibacillus antarcticus]|nr:phytoene desaturase family protein [Paenibacillus antarcticus]
MNRKVIIVGSGFGGLSCAITMAARGWGVTLIERQSTLGGKLQQIQEEGYTFDRGPSTITMPNVFRDVFDKVGACMEDYVELYELEPRSRNIFADGSRVDLSRNVSRMEDQIATYSPTDALHYAAYIKEAGLLYQHAEAQFMNKLLLSWRDKANLPMLRSLWRVRPFTTLQKLLERYFSHPNTLAMFGRYATYVGSSPYQAPSIFAMLGHVEAKNGVYGVRGGTYRLIEAMARLARELGVSIMTDTEVTQIVVAHGRTTGVETNKGFYEAPIVVANGDVLSVNRMLIQEQDRPSMRDRRIGKYESSLSGFVTLAGVRQQYSKLLHHTVFFPHKYEPEFRDIFERRLTPADPTVYVCYSGYSEQGMAPKGGSNLFILANAPSLSGYLNWETEKKIYGDAVLSTLSQHGISGLDQGDVFKYYTPEDIARDTLAYKGSIYGISSNSIGQTFSRPSNRSKDIEGLWYVGGTTHPGGGTPMVTLSGRLVGEYITEHMV